MATTSPEIRGTVYQIDPLENVTETFKKRSFILCVEPDSDYPEYLTFETVQDKTKILDPIKPGDEIKVLFNIRGRLYDNKKTGRKAAFTGLQAWKIESEDGSNVDGYTPPPAQPEQDEEDDLPF